MQGFGATRRMLPRGARRARAHGTLADFGGVLGGADGGVISRGDRVRMLGGADAI